MHKPLMTHPLVVALLVSEAVMACGLACSQSTGDRPGGGGASGGTDAAAGRTGGGGAAGSQGGRGGDGGATTAGGGASGAALEPYFHAGTRLEPRVFRVGDLEVIDKTQEGGWYDVETHDWCDFLVGADGVERCLPYATFSDDPTQIMYLDADCTRPAVLAATPYCDRTAGAPRYITGQPSSGCGYRTYQLGDVLPGTTPLYGKAGESCELLPATTALDYGVWPLGQEVPLGTFVSVKRVSRPRHPQMNALVREGKDGSWEIIGFSDPGTGAPCFGLGLDISPPVCVPDLPDAASAGDFFSDMACEQPVRLGLGGIPGCSLNAAAVILDVATNAFVCPFTMSIAGLWKTAGVRTAPAFNTSPDAQCGPALPDATVVYDQGPPIDLASIPRLDVIEVGSGPLTLAFYGFGGVPFLPAPHKFFDAPVVRFTDVARKEPCDPFVFGDGKWRCVPSSFVPRGSSSLFFESSDCTGTPLFAAARPGLCSDTTRAPAGVIIITESQQGCTNQPVGAAAEIGGPVTTSAVSQNRGSFCLSASVSATNDFLELKPQLNPDEVFVTMERGLKQ